MLLLENNQPGPGFDSWVDAERLSMSEVCTLHSLVSSAHSGFVLIRISLAECGRKVESFDIFIHIPVFSFRLTMAFRFYLRFTQHPGWNFHMTAFFFCFFTSDRVLYKTCANNMQWWLCHCLSHTHTHRWIQLCTEYFMLHKDVITELPHCDSSTVFSRLRIIYWCLQKLFCSDWVLGFISKAFVSCGLCLIHTTTKRQPCFLRSLEVMTKKEINRPRLRMCRTISDL